MKLKIIAPIVGHKELYLDDYAKQNSRIIPRVGNRGGF
jgi:hypothetical protein